MGRYRWAALSLWLGGLLGVWVRFLFMASHGPTEYDEMNVVLGLTQHDFERWSLFPGLLVIWGLMAVHQYQLERYGRLGRVGYRITIGGYWLGFFGIVWDFVLFDPFEHPVHSVGVVLGFLALLMVLVGWVVWGTASYKAKSAPSWSLPVPFLMVIGSVLALVFSEALYGAFSIDGGVAFNIVWAIGFLVLGLVLWRADETLMPHSATAAVD